jgi:hypothetical protein
MPDGWISTRGSPFFGARDDSQKTLPMAYGRERDTLRVGEKVVLTARLTAIG